MSGEGEFDAFTAALVKQLRLARDSALQLARQLEVTLTMVGDPLAAPLVPEQRMPRRFMQPHDDDAPPAGATGTTDELTARLRAHDPVRASTDA